MDCEELEEMLGQIGEKTDHEKIQFPLSSGQTLVVLVQDLTYVACKVVETQQEADDLHAASCRAFRVVFYLVPSNQVDELPLGQAFPCN